MMNHYQEYSCVDEINQQNNHTDNLDNDQRSLSPPKKVQKRQRKPSKTSTYGLTQTSTNNESDMSTHRQYLSTNLNSVTSTSAYAPGYTPYPYPPPWYVPAQNQHAPVMQAAQNAFSIQSNPINSWRLPGFPIPSTTPYVNNQFSENRETTPTVQYPMPSPYYVNQSSSWQNPLSAMLPSTIFQSNGPMAPNIFQQRQFGPVFQRTTVGPTSPFQIYQRPSNGETLELPSESAKTPSYSQSNEGPASTFDLENAISSLKKLIGSSESEKNVQEDQKENQHVNLDNDQMVGTSNHVTEKHDFSCVICEDTRKDTVLIPCLHLCVCKKCSANIDLCPLCRKTIQERMTVFT